MQTVGTNRRSLSHDRRQTTIGSYPSECVRIGREQHVPDSIACTQNPPTLATAQSPLPTRCQNTPALAWWRDCGAARSSRAAHSSLPTRSQKKKTHSLTLLLQNHLDQDNILLGCGTSTRAVARALQANHNPPKSPQQSATGSAALAHPESVARFVSTSTPPESP